MALNFTTEVYTTFISVIIVTISSLVVLKQHRASPDAALLTQFIAWISFALFQLFNGVAYLTLNEIPFLVKNVFLIIMAISGNISMSLMNRGEINRLGLAIISFVSAFALAAIMLPNPIKEDTFSNGEKTFSHLGFNRIMIFGLMLYIIIAYTFYAVKIMKHVPENGKGKARVFLIGILIFGPGGLITFGTGLSGQIPGITDIVISIGVLISSIGLARAPQLLYVLPFKAVKLSVIETNSGINIYNYHWYRTKALEFSDELFAATLHAISIFVKEGIGHGSVEEVKLEGATLIISDPPSQKVFYIILATKPSYTLRRGLDKFALLFNIKFTELLRQDVITDITDFDLADDLILKCFPYIPTRD